MEPDYLARLFEVRSRSRMRDFGTQVVAGASPDDLDPRLLDRFRGEISGDDRETALLKLEMVAEDESGVPRPTVAGMLLGSRLPQRWLPQAFIQAVAYRGASIGEALDEPHYQLDAKDLDGPLDDQIAYACRFVARNQRVEASKAMGPARLAAVRPGSDLRGGGKRRGTSRLLYSRRQGTPAHVLRSHRTVLTGHADERHDRRRPALQAAGKKSRHHQSAGPLPRSPKGSKRRA